MNHSTLPQAERILFALPRARMTKCPAATLLLLIGFTGVVAAVCSSNDFVVADNTGTEYLRVNTSGVYACGGQSMCSRTLALNGASLSLSGPGGNAVGLPTVRSSSIDGSLLSF